MVQEREHSFSKKRSKHTDLLYTDSCNVIRYHASKFTNLPIVQISKIHTERDQKRVYYLSLEFLLGRSLDNALLNLGLKDAFGGTNYISNTKQEIRILY